MKTQKPLFEGKRLVFERPIPWGRSGFLVKVALVDDTLAQNERKESAIRQILSKYASNSDTLGIYLFGSFSRGEEHPKSDVDICVILKKGVEKRVDEKIDGVSFSVILRPLENFQYIFQHNVEWAIDQIKNCKVLYDPGGVVKKLVELSELYRIPKELVLEDLRLSIDALESAEDLIKNGDFNGARICISYAAWKAGRAFLKANQILYRGPKYLCEQLRCRH